MSGGMFAVSAVAIRGAALSLGDADVLVRAVVTLAVITTLQTLTMTAYLAWRERPELRKVVIFWRPAALVGLMSVVGSEVRRASWRGRVCPSVSISGVVVTFKKKTYLISASH